MHRLMLIAFLVLLSITALAERADAQTRVYAETDPSTFGFHGYAAHARIATPALGGWTVGAGTYAMDFPSVLVDLDPENRDNGWGVRLDAGYGLFADRYRRGDEGWSYGAQLALQRYEVERDGSSDDLTTVLLMPRTGYTWFPWDDGFYVFPWVGVGLTTAVTDAVTLGDATYHVAPVLGFATVHLGWRF